MSSAIKDVTIICNTRTGQTGTFRATWLNTVSNQEVVNVRIGRLTTSWNMAEAAVLS